MDQQVIPIDLGIVNCYLIHTEKGFVLVDTGGHGIIDKQFTNRRELLINALEKAGCNSSNLKLIILTHGDNDHVCNAAYVREKYGAKIAIHKKDIKLVKNPDINDLMASFQYRSFLFKAVFRLMHKKIYNISKKTLEDFESFTPDILLEDNQDLKEYGVEGTIIHIPGHTPGSVGVLLNHILISGDTFANFKKPSLAPNALDFMELKHSVEKLKSYKIDTIYPGHGKSFKFQDIAINKL